MNVILLGDGGHSKVIQEIIYANKDYQIIAILDDKYEYMTKNNGVIHAPMVYLNKLMTTDTKVIVAIGDNVTRKLLSKKFFIRDDQCLTVVHPSAVVSPTATIGYGTVVMPGAYINAKASIGKHCIINTGAIIEHDVCAGNYSHISPNATLTGDVSVGEGVHIGSSSTIIPGVEVGNWSVIGAGSTVIKHIPSFTTAVGSPTRIVRNQQKENKEVRL